MKKEEEEGRQEGCLPLFLPFLLVLGLCWPSFFGCLLPPFLPLVLVLGCPLNKCVGRSPPVLILLGGREGGREGGRNVSGRIKS